MQYRILVVDDDKEIVEAVSVYLKNEGYIVLRAYNGEEAMRALDEGEIHLILMDVMMPKIDGLRATMRIRETRGIPIILLSAKSEETDKILGLNMGADDYITKPFSPLELLARVRSQLRRYTQLGGQTSAPSRIINGGLELDTEAKTVTVDGEEIRLTATEYKILSLLLQNIGRVFSIGEIYERVWNEPSYNAENTVAVHIRRIREKIEINPGEPNYLKVVWGIGYKMERIEKQPRF